MLKTLTKIHPTSLLGTLVRMPLRVIPRGTVVSVKGGINKGVSWIVGSSTHGCWLGTYESEKQDLIAKLVQPGMVVWDVGANAGFYTLAFARLVGDMGYVYAFEPYAENANNLLRHLRLNEISKVTLVQAALGARDGLIGFRVTESSSMGYTSQEENTYLVPAVSVDEFLARHPGALPDLIKIDIEGAETDLLLGATQLLRDSSPVVVLALHGQAQSNQCTELLTSLGYSLYYLDGYPVAETPLKSDEIYARKEGAIQRAVPADSHRHSDLADF